MIWICLVISSWFYPGRTFLVRILPKGCCAISGHHIWSPLKSVCPILGVVQVDSTRLLHCRAVFIPFAISKSSVGSSCETVNSCSPFFPVVESFSQFLLNIRTLKTYFIIPVGCRHLKFKYLCIPLVKCCWKLAYKYISL